MTNISFFIEGFVQDNTKEIFPEIEKAKNFAGKNNIKIFDSMKHPYAPEVISKAAFEVSIEDIIMEIVIAFGKTYSIENIKYTLITPALEELRRQGFEIPSISNISGSALKVLTMMLQDRFNNDFDLLKEHVDYASQKMLDCSNSMFAESLLDHLNKHEEIEEIYALIGASHLPMLDSSGIIIESSSTYRKVEIISKDRTVVVHLFGGRHGDMSHLDKMMDTLKNYHAEFFDDGASLSEELVSEDLIIAEYEVTQKLSFFGQEALKAGFPYELAFQVDTAYPIYAREIGLPYNQALEIKHQYQFEALKAGFPYELALQVDTAYPIDTVYLYNKLLSSMSVFAIDYDHNKEVTSYAIGEVANIETTPYKLALNIKEVYQFKFLVSGCSYKQAIEVHTAYPIDARNAGLSCEESIQINTLSKFNEFVATELKEAVVLAGIAMESSE